MGGEEMNDFKKKFKRSPAWWIILILIVVVSLWLLTPFIIKGVIYSEIDKAGQFGDMFGAINALFSGLALIGVIVAIFLQRRELDYTRMEMVNQTTTFNRQRFQDSFFQLLKIQTNFVQNSEEYITGGQNIIPFNAFKQVITDFEQERKFDLTDKWQHKDVEEDFCKAYKKLAPFLDAYLFRLETLMILVHRSNIEDKEFFVEIIRGSMTEEEVEFVTLTNNYYTGKFIELERLSKMYTLTKPSQALATARLQDMTWRG